MDIYLDVRAYVADVFGGNPEDVSLDWNAVGACIHYFDNRRNIQFRLWERSEGHLGIPDMTLIVINISVRGIKETARSENHEPLTTDQVPGCRIACYRL